ncbi:MAG: DUF5680 domain-containing protein [Nanoarchaeota archaeon]
MKLSKFIAEAKKATYAGNDAEKKLPDESKELIYEKNNLIYRDRYFGSKSFSGQEVIFNKNKPIWSMNYYGRSLKGLLLTKKIYNFLRKALLRIPESSPFRGPRKLVNCSWRYRNDWNGDLKNFNGKEKIFYKDELVYELEYFGGIVKNDS